jgi:hypothetical protein
MAQDRAQQAADAIAALEGSTASEIREALDEYDAKDVTAAIASTASSGGSQTLAEVLAEGNDADGLAIENLADPSADQEAATKKYVDDNAGGAVQTATVALTDAQIKALPTTARTVVAGPAAGQMHVIVGALFQVDTTVAAYTNIDAAAATLFLTVASGAQSKRQVQIENTPNSTELTDLLAGFSKAWIYAGAWSAMLVADAHVFGSNNDGYDWEAAPITVKATNGASGNFTGGNAANTMTVTVLYVTISI